MRHLKQPWAHLAVVKGVAWEEADLGVHPVLDVEEVDPHPQELQALKQTASVAEALGQGADDCRGQLLWVPHQHQDRKAWPPLALVAGGIAKKHKTVTDENITYRHRDTGDTGIGSYQ